MDKYILGIKNLLEGDRRVAEIILKQLGGVNRLHAMLGIKSVYSLPDGDGGVAFRFPNKRAGAPNYVEISLNGKDLYDIKFVRIRGASRKVIKQLKDIYAADLKDVFVEYTGLNLTL